MPPQVDAAVARGLEFLGKAKNADGSFDADGRPRVAMTALAVMSMLASGHTPDQGRYAPAVRSALDFLMRVAPADGYFGQVDGSRMYGHGMVTLALAESYGVETDPARRRQEFAVLGRAVDVILKAQDVPKDPANAGGWRYEPQSADSDLSLSGWNALALRAAQSAGVDVPKDRVQRAVGYVLKCYRKDQKGFAYQPGSDATQAMTGVGALDLYLLDAADRPEATAGADYLAGHPVTDDTRFAYYATYYATQAAHQAGGTAWSRVWAVTQARLVPAQDKDGGWPVSKTGEEPGRVYATSMAVLTLSVPYRLLPIYQR